MNTKIMPVTDLRRQTKEVIDSIQKNGEIVYITQHGRPTVVLVDYEQYEAMKAKLAEQQSQTRNQKAIELLQTWIDDGDEEEQKETGRVLIEEMDKNRSSNRKLFPAEKKGISW